MFVCLGQTSSAALLAFRRTAPGIILASTWPPVVIFFSTFRIFSRGILSRRSFVSLCEAGSPALSDDNGSDFPPGRRPLRAGGRLLTSAFPIPTSAFRIPTSAFRIPTSAFLLPTSHFRIPHSEFPLPHSPFPPPTFPLPENNPDRCFVQTGFFPQLVDQVSFVGKMNSLGVVDKADDRGWFGGYLGGIVKFDAFAAVK